MSIVNAAPGISISVADRQQLWDVAHDVIGKTKKPPSTIGTRARPDVRACLALILTRPTVAEPLTAAGQLSIA